MVGGDGTCSPRSSASPADMGRAAACWLEKVLRSKGQFGSPFPSSLLPRLAGEVYTAQDDEDGARLEGVAEMCTFLILFLCGFRGWLCFGKVPSIKGGYPEVSAIIFVQRLGMATNPHLVITDQILAQGFFFPVCDSSDFGGRKSLLLILPKNVFRGWLP